MNVLANPLNHVNEITVNMSVKEAEKLLARIEQNWPKPYKHEGGKEMIELYKQLTASVTWRRREERKESK